MSVRWKVAIVVIVLLAVYSVGVTWYSVSHSADLEARLESKRVWGEEFIQVAGRVLKEKSQLQRDMASEVRRLEAISKEIDRERDAHRAARLELGKSQAEVKRYEWRLTDRDRKLSGEYQLLAQDLINKFVRFGGAYWEGMDLQEDWVFGVDFYDRNPTTYSSRWVMLYFDDTMKWLEKDARVAGHYYGYGNLGDVILQRLEHVVVAAQKGLIPRGEAIGRIARMERYARPGDTKTWELLGLLREKASS